MIVITGANGHLGRRLIATLAGQEEVRALVRSRSAAEQLTGAGVDVRIVDYLDQTAMERALDRARAVVHLVGIIRESSRSSFESAHEGTSRILVQAAEKAGSELLLYLSILGATPDSANACLASKARAEGILLDGPVPAVVLRVPMVLGEGDFASRALEQRARRRLDVQFRSASLEQPIYAGDVTSALIRLLLGPPLPAGDDEPILELAGPESLSRRALVQRAAAVLGCPPPLILSLPVSLGFVLAAGLEWLLDDPPLSRAMLGVLDHDDRIDPQPALARLGVALTPLDDCLRRCFQHASPAAPAE